MPKSYIILLLLFIGLLAACTKGPGTGGRASIQGKVFAVNYNNSYVATDSGFISAHKVYIRYGDESGVGDNVDTDNTGTFLFPYLRTGKYTMFVLSKKLVNNTLDSAVVVNVTVKDKKGVTEVPTIRINTFKN